MSGTTKMTLQFSAGLTSDQERDAVQRLRTAIEDAGGKLTVEGEEFHILSVEHVPPPNEEDSDE